MSQVLPSPSFSSVHASLRDAFATGLPIQPETETRLRDALLHTLAHPGSLVRAQLAFELCVHYGMTRNEAEKLAVAIEYFHTASLVFDDLPCMDDAGRRRGAPCVHRLHGEATAILSALALVNRAYALAWQAIQSAPSQYRQAAGDYLEKCLGIAGILNGQSRDLHYASLPKITRTPQHVALGKTVPLIQLSLVLPAILGGASETEQRLLERLATFWGLSYQIIDDLKDLFSSSELTGKTAARDALLNRPNTAQTAGARSAFRRLERLLRLGDCALSRFFCCRPGIRVLNQLREKFAEELAAFHPIREFNFENAA